ncbi:hypothetical protein E2C01_092494 [Portunus trituberculatus]|uniref:Uncharacterized protein n=1 Tax=Portunus trituberculatus TaxID=210409 RepID=A0A5B7JRW3_PORTR|nr:hypothetical protein [Portunus trituberculatus]
MEEEEVEEEEEEIEESRVEERQWSMWFCTASALWRINRRLEHVNLLDEKWRGVPTRGAASP